MGRAQRESKAPSKMTREQLEALITGLCDHRLAAIEERLAALEHKSSANDEPKPLEETTSLGG
jgi:hypothetical protein